MKDLDDVIKALQYSEQTAPVNRRIVTNVAPGVLIRFMTKGADYGDASALLGQAGQFSDINRKFWKLYRAIWLGKELVGEGVAEICEDIIGHCLILIDMVQPDERSARDTDSSVDEGGVAPDADPVVYGAEEDVGDDDPEADSTPLDNARRVYASVMKEFRHHWSPDSVLSRAIWRGICDEYDVNHAENPYA